MKSILDRTFQYTPSFRTDLKATFARLRRDDVQYAAREPDEAAPAAAVVTAPTGSTRSTG